MSTAFHSKYWAAALTLRGPSGAIESLTRSIANSRVDLNPHQVDAALFAIRSPLTKGVLLADEVGLGKTVEAGIVITQRWAARRRKILLILPATLGKQWQQELTDKFSLPSVILEGRTAELRQPDKIAICSYHFAAARADEMKQFPWDLVVVDEAHRLRKRLEDLQQDCSSHLKRHFPRAQSPDDRDPAAEFPGGTLWPGQHSRPASVWRHRLFSRPISQREWKRRRP